MLHARIAARAFNTPLLVEPSKAMAFLSGLGPRILVRRVETPGPDDGSEGPAPLPAAKMPMNMICKSMRSARRSRSWAGH